MFSLCFVPFIVVAWVGLISLWQVSYQLDCVVEFGVECGTPLPPVKAIDFIMQLSESAACVSLVLDIAENVSSSLWIHVIL